MIFVETKVFTQDITGLGAEEQLRELQNLLFKNPNSGDVISGLDGLRKIRMPLPGRGKRGSARVLYLFFLLDDKIVFLHVYTKNDFEDLPQAMRKNFKVKIKEIRKEFQK